MKLSTKGRYGLRALIDLAVHSQEGHVPLAKIAERQGLSEIYLEQVFAALRKSGIVKSVKGAQGGYLLAAPPAKVTVGDILRVLEGELTVVDGEDRMEKGTIAGTVRKLVWDKMDERINRYVDGITLEALVEEHKKINYQDFLMYYI
ncbi:RrF2 family transcriptional regulator [Anaerotalea alkaliphila]|uniref:Rrf2 family transcriptional regulator n=1 Tax=Anaerotalea alkaliphila TaxID=2662126 RepID=A0A7X5KP66_9FIRM|nr:Rrf2 family transcriptional regulator [Anaerotalea alkaliphila]NDL68759.1 Rrf2 family transcriptional regulator [Anaerotalea alkaliphila]